MFSSFVPEFSVITLKLSMKCISNYLQIQPSYRYRILL